MIYVACLLSGAFCQGMVSQNHVKRPSPEEWQLPGPPCFIFTVAWRVVFGFRLLLATAWPWRVLCHLQLQLRNEPVSAPNKRNEKLFQLCSVNVCLCKPQYTCADLKNIIIPNTIHCLSWQGHYWIDSECLFTDWSTKVTFTQQQNMIVCPVF